MKEETKTPQTPSSSDESERPPPEDGDSTDLRALIGQLRELPKPVWILAGGMFINRFGNFVIPFLFLYMEKAGFSIEVYGWTMAAMAGGGIVSSFLGGRLSDWLGRRNTMAISLFGGGAAMLLLWQATGLSTFVLGGFCIGLTHALYYPASNSLLIDVVPVNRRVTAFAVVRWALNLGFAFGMAAGGFLARYSYSLLFIGDAISSVIFGFIVISFLPHGIRVARHESRWKPALESIFSNPRFLAFWSANLLAVALFFQWGAAVSKLVIDLGYTEIVYGSIMAFNGLMIAVLELPVSQVCRRFRPRMVIGWGFLFCGIGLSFNLFAISWAWILVACVVFTIGEMISMPISNAYLGELAPEKMRGRYNGAISLTWHVGHAFAPALGVWFYLQQPSVLWIGSAVAGVLAAAIMWRVK